MSHVMDMTLESNQRPRSKILNSANLAQKATPILLIPTLKHSKTYINSLINTFFEWFRQLSISSMTDTVCSKMPSCQLSASLLPLHFLKWTWIIVGSLTLFMLNIFRFIQGCGNTMPNLSDLVPFHSGQVRNFCLLVHSVFHIGLLILNLHVVWKTVWILISWLLHCFQLSL